MHRRIEGGIRGLMAILGPAGAESRPDIKTQTEREIAQLYSAPDLDIVQRAYTHTRTQQKLGNSVSQTEAIDAVMETRRREIDVEVRKLLDNLDLSLGQQYSAWYWGIQGAINKLQSGINENPDSKFANFAERRIKHLQKQQNRLNYLTRPNTSDLEE